MANLDPSLSEKRDESAAIPSAAARPAPDPTRRDFLQGSARKLAYATPIILLFHPSRACASGGSQLSESEP